VKPKQLLKPRDPAFKLRSQGALRQRVVADKRKVLARKSKHKKSALALAG